MKAIIKSIAFVTCMALLASMIYCLNTNEKYCEGISYYKGLGWQGMVLGKYRDTLNHHYETLLINDKGSLQKLYFITDTSRVYKIFKIGDYVEKEKDSLTVFVRSGLFENTFTLKYICN